MYSGGALSRDTLPIQNQPCLCPDSPLYPSTLRGGGLATRPGTASSLAALQYPPLYSENSWSRTRKKQKNNSNIILRTLWPIGFVGKTPVGKTYDAAIPGSRLPGTKEKKEVTPAQRPFSNLTSQSRSPREYRFSFWLLANLPIVVASSRAVACSVVAVHHQAPLRFRASMRVIERRCASFSVALRSALRFVQRCASFVIALRLALRFVRHRTSWLRCPVRRCASRVFRHVFRHVFRSCSSRALLQHRASSRPRLLPFNIAARNRGSLSRFFVAACHSGLPARLRAPSWLRRCLLSRFVIATSFAVVALSRLVLVRMWRVGSHYRCPSLDVVTLPPVYRACGFWATVRRSW